MIVSARGHCLVESRQYRNRSKHKNSWDRGKTPVQPPQQGCGGDDAEESDEGKDASVTADLGRDKCAEEVAESTYRCEEDAQQCQAGAWARQFTGGSAMRYLLPAPCRKDQQVEKADRTKSAQPAGFIFVWKLRILGGGQASLGGAKQRDGMVRNRSDQIPDFQSVEFRFGRTLECHAGIRAVARPKEQRLAKDRAACRDTHRSRQRGRKNRRTEISAFERSPESRRPARRTRRKKRCRRKRDQPPRSRSRRTLGTLARAWSTSRAPARWPPTPPVELRSRGNADGAWRENIHTAAGRKSRRTKRQSVRLKSSRTKA